MLKNSIVEYGFLVPLTVDSKMVIVTGHSRYYAAKALKYETLPVIVLDLPDKKLNEYRIADNAAAEHSEFQVEELSKLLESEGYKEDEGFMAFFQKSKKTAKKGSKAYEHKTDELDGLEVLAPSSEIEEFICPHCLHEFTGTIEEFMVKED